MVRGIERRAIVDDDKDREDFVTRMDRYKWCGHSVIMNRCQSPWQDRRYVLKWFGRKERDTMQKGKGSGCHASIRQSPPAFAEAQESDRLETDQQIWCIVS
jgi:hypothetical protein